MCDLATAIERLYALKVGLVGRGPDQHERPHKPLLLLAVLELLDRGEATPDHIPWDSSLRERFSRYFAMVRGKNDRDTPDNPFHHLSSDGFWQPYRINHDGKREPLQANPLVSDSGRVFAELTDGFDQLCAVPENRRQLRGALVTRYFPGVASGLLGAEADRADLYGADRTTEETTPGLGERMPDGRSAAFRRKVVEIYDSQCAACGLRIRLPGVETTFVDAAHLVPFATSANDHPSNGIALCKNHHWAMDRRLIAPGPDLQWHVSALLDARRSSGERALRELENEVILLPGKPAFYPAEQGLRWRVEQLRG